MSAITGIFCRDGRKVKPELIKKVNNSLSHRGPDGSAIWLNGYVGLGHQMMWTTQESLNEKLPFEEGELVITADARIDNRKELSEKLHVKNNEDVSDSYFILKAYEMWGENCPEHLLGDFAFAIWDKKGEKLFCAKDHMGVKPFYYYLTDELFVFGTEIKAIINISIIPFELNEERLALFLTENDLFEKESTFYKDIRSLTSAQSLIIDKNKSRHKRYWKLNSESQIIMDSDEDYAKAFLEIFTEAVRCRMRSYNSIGVMLSGGLDSSSVTCMANKINIENESKDRIQSFSYIFDDYPSIDERYYINKVVELGGIKSHFIKSDEISPLDEIEDKLTFYDQPLSTYHIGVIHESNKIIQKMGIRILLTGEGGDQIVSHGTNFLEELLITFQWKKLMNNINNISEVRRGNRYKLFISTVFHLINYYKLQWPIFFSLLKSDDKIVNKEFSNKYKLNEISNQLERYYNVTNEKETHYYFIELGRQLSFEMLDQDSSMFSIDMRHPFYDKRLVEFCYAIPSEIKIKFGFSRYVNRIALEGILPKEIQWRPTKSKMGFVGANNFLSEKKIIERVINDNDKIIRKYVDLNKLQKAFRIGLEDKSSISTTYLWRVVLFYFWLLNKENFKNYLDD